MLLRFFEITKKHACQPRCIIQFKNLEKVFPAQPVDLNQFKLPAHYQWLPFDPATISEKVSVQPFTSVGLESILPPLSQLSLPLTLDSDAYLNSKIPAPITELLTHQSAHLTFVAGLWPETQNFIQKMGLEKIRFLAPARQRIGLIYGIGASQCTVSETAIPLVGRGPVVADKPKHLCLEVNPAFPGCILLLMRSYLPSFSKTGHV